MKKITVFTPTYNRRHLLPRLYESLVHQNDDRFVWLIVDDGSTDDTASLVEEWQSEKKLTIQYIYQQNQGMHGAHNTAYANINTPWNLCIDSDDLLAPNVIASLCSLIDARNWDGYAGILALDADLSGNILGTEIPSSTDNVKLNDLYLYHGMKGDKKLIYKTEVVREFPPYPIFSGEKLVPLGTKYLMIDQKYDLYPLNQVICLVDYQEDGSSKTIFRQYKVSPKGFAEHRLLRIQYEKSLVQQFKHSMHLVSCFFFSRDYKTIFRTDKKGLLFLSFPFGFLLHLYIRFQINKMK